MSLRFTLTAQSLFQVKRQLDKLGELVVKVTYESDPIPLQKPQMEERVKYLIYHLIKRYAAHHTAEAWEGSVRLDSVTSSLYMYQHVLHLHTNAGGGISF